MKGEQEPLRQLKSRFACLFSQDLRFKVQKLVAAKATLAARADSLHSASDGSIGDKFRAELEAKIDKLMEPPPVKTVKALPLPLEGQRKKRGGRRFVFIFISSYILPLQISLRSPFFAFFVFISPIIPIHLLIAPFSFPFSSTLVAFSSFI